MSYMVNGGLKLLADRELRVKMGEAGRAWLEREYSAEKWVGRLQEIYHQTVRRQKPERIYVVEFLGRGGMIHYAYQLCRAFAEQEVEVHLITDRNYELEDRPHNFLVKRLFRLWDPRPEHPINSPQSFRGVLKHGVRRVVRALQYYSSWWKLIRHLRRQKPGVVLMGDIRFPLDLLPLLLLRSRRNYLAGVCHNVTPFDIRADSKQVVKTSALYRLCYRSIFRCFASIFVHSENSRRELIQTYQESGEKIHVIPHGNEDIFLETNRSQDNGQWRRRLGLPANVPTALFFGTITKYKGVDQLLEAFAQTVKDLPSAHLIIAGYPNPDVRVESLRARLRSWV